MTPEQPEVRASDAERERAAEVLREAAAEGRLRLDEFEERLDAAYQARTRGELELLVRDLPEPGTAVAGPARSPAAEGRWAQRIGGGAAPASRTGIGIMGGFARKGTWTVPRRFTAFVFWGGGEIDLREARFEDREVVIRCIAIMGGVDVILPPDAEVEVRGLGIMGGFDHTATGAGAPGAPRVVVTGFAFWGGVATERRANRAERKRLRAERERHRLEHRWHREHSEHPEHRKDGPDDWGGRKG